MKKSGLLIIVLVAQLSFHCKQASKEKTYHVQWNIKPGDSYRLRLISKNDNGIEVEGVRYNTIANLDLLIRFEMLEDSASFHRLRLNYEQAKVEIKKPVLPGQPSDTLDYEKLGKHLKGSSIVLLLNENRQVAKVIGMDAVIAQAPLLNQKEEEQLREIMSKEQVGKMMDMMFQIYPGKPVKIGDTWEKETETEILQITAKLKNKFTLKQVKDGVATIDVVGQYEGKDEFEQSDVTAEMELRGIRKGSTTIRLENGLVNESEYLIDINATANVMEMKIPYTMNSMSSIKNE